MYQTNACPPATETNAGAQVYTSKYKVFLILQPLKLLADK